MSNVLIVSPGPDVAGCGIALKRAFDAVGGEWQARHLRRKDNWLRYPADVDWPKGTDAGEAAALYAWADVIHVMDRPADFFAGHGKPIIVQHLGSRYRRDPDALTTACRAIGALEVSDLDLLLINPALHYLPVAVDVPRIAPLREQYAAGRKIRIAHAPTNRALKSTAQIVETVERLARRYPIRFDLIERAPWAECLKRKAQADIYIDEFDLGYGMNALECWAMGIPVVSGAFPALRHAIAERAGILPFVQADPETLEQVVSSLITRPALRAEWGERGRAYVERHHAPAAVVELATAYYRHAAAAVAA